MKKILPVITILTFLSLVGIVFFQLLWVTNVYESEEQKFNSRISDAIFEASQYLIEEKGNLTGIKTDSLHGSVSEKLQNQYFNGTISQRYSVDEIRQIIRKAFNEHQLRKVAFEFSIRSNTTESDELMSDNFYTYFADTVNNFPHVIPIESPAGSLSEGMVPEELLIVLVPHVKSFIWRSIRWFLLGTVMFTFIILTAFFLTFRTLLQQKKLSEIKSDFINNMTHEFKTPITTISLAADALRNSKVLDRREEIEKYVQIIKTENSRMNQQVETILEAALLEKNEIKLNLKPIHAITLIESALQNINLPLQEKKGRMTLKLDATNDLLSIDEVHFTNLISNLLDNAVKYSKDNPEIKITTSNTASVFIVSIEDNGIGMDRDTAKQIFEKFYRAHTGNLHNVKGFGLGLSYVKTIVDALGGVIKVDSVLGRGTIFTLQFPLIH